MLGLAMAEFETWGLREEKNADAENDSPDPAETDDNAPGGGGVGLVGDSAVVEAGGEEDAHCDEELVGAKECQSLCHFFYEGVLSTHQTIAPRIHGGAVSAWYMGTNNDKAPTPSPATNLPIMI